MARPFRNEFEKEQSPMSPLSSGAATPTSYKTNMNRQKTKKWVEAKPVDYGGDDWGDDDDEYDPPPPPISKPTGLRQKGQAMQSPIGDNNKKNYGDLPSLPATRGRSNSFDADDEKRNFSSGPSQPPSSAAAPAPATRFSQIAPANVAPSLRVASGPPSLHITTQQPHNIAPRSVSQIVSPTSGSPQLSYQLGPNDSPSKAIVSPLSDTRTPSSDYQARRDFSPSAVVPPLHTRTPSASQGGAEPVTTKFPPRKSSMSQKSNPIRSPQESSGPKPWTSERSASPGSSARSSAAAPAASTTKALPFIRPADIYRRADEERERERQSMESGRPSMDSILGTRFSERSESPAKNSARDQSRDRSSSPGKKLYGREQPNTESLGFGRHRGSMEADDGSDSGRKLMPMLAPVQERKSEYGFDGFDATQDPGRAAAGSEAPSTSEQDYAQETRVQTTSPKLPDLNRMSGFGMDMFSERNPEGEALPQEQESTPISASTIHPSSPPTSDPALRNQPSLGFRSVVHQAFDRPDRSNDSSVPATPASRSGSGVRRTDSESTGTTGISPIMSRVPSAANPDSRNRDNSNAAVLEVVNETSPVQGNADPQYPTANEEDTPLPPYFKPGHRRDLSTPSPGNSPARTPDLARNDSIPQAEQALLSRAPDNTAIAPLPNVENPSGQTRPVAEREQSFRPQLPGGWTSFATTNTGNATPNEDVDLPESSDLVGNQAAVSKVSPIREGHDEEYDITPTTAKHPLPRADSPVDVATTQNIGKDQDTPDDSVSETSRAIPSYDAMPTPDLSMAPSGNVYSANALDPRLLPNLERVSPEAQLRPAVTDRTISTNSSAAPTPPPKDTPAPEIIADDASGYFPKPTVPLKQRQPSDTSDEGLQPPSRPQVLPTLSTDTRPQDQESDKLRKEIIKSLSPRPSDAGTRPDSLEPDQLDEPLAAGQGRESAYIPDSIYDNYWGDEADEESPQLSKHTTREAIPEVLEHPALPTIAMDAPKNEDPEIPPTPPLNTRRSQLSTHEPRPSLSTRFSWERSKENVNISDPNSENSPDIKDPAELPSTEPVGELNDPLATREPPFQEQTAVHEEEEAAKSTRTSVSSEDHHGRDAAVLTGAAAGVVGATAVSHAHHHSQTPSAEPGRRLSLAEEKDPRVSSYPVSPTPPEDEHPARSPLPYNPDGLDQTSVSFSGSPSMTNLASGVASPGQHFSHPDTKLLAFKEIAAMGDSDQRIQTFDEHRHRFAAMDSGLSDWLLALQDQHPEHLSGAGGIWGTSTTNGSARSKFIKTGASLQPPQPYYQQYLNASSPTTPTSPSSRPGPSIPAGSQQGFATGGGKITSQQVQAKGKELLHTAGIFSGKAGKGAAKAGKGLLAKGKSRFRGSGGGDKTETSPKPKNERRTSWGLPLALSRSTVHLDSSSRHSRESRDLTPSRPTEPRDFPNTPDTPNTPVGLLNNTPSFVQDTSHEATQLQSLQVLPDAPASTSHIPEINQSAPQDNLSGPVPISKDQPSWDPYNATPIVEEEGFNFEERPKHLAPVPVQEEKSDRSNSGDASFYDAPEEPARDDEWVMVTPERKITPEVEVGLAKAIEVQTSILHRPRGSFDIAMSSPHSPTTPVRAHVISHEPRTPSASFRSSDDAVRPDPISKQAEPEDPFTKGPSTLLQNNDAGVRPNPASKQTEPDKPIPRDPSFRGLPPIRRTSTFGFGFGPRQAKPRFPIDDEDEDGPVPNQEELVSINSRQGISGAIESAPPEFDAVDRGIPPQSNSRPPSQYQVQAHVRPDLVHASSSEYSQQTVMPQANLQREPSLPRLLPIARDNSQKRTMQPPDLQREPSLPKLLPITRDESQQRIMQQQPNLQREPSLPRLPGDRDSYRKSQDNWRPNANSQHPSMPPSAQNGLRRSQEAWRPNAVPPPTNQRQYVDPMQNRPFMQNGQRPDVVPRPAMPNQQNSFDQPPSAAYRYPQLFRPGQQVEDAPRDSGDIPDGYYQAPIHRDEAFLPRQQTSEYQLPGVGPPVDQPRGGASRRNSFFRDLGGKISRNASRERGQSISRDDSGRPIDSRGNEMSESSITSEEAQARNKHKRRSSLFGGINRSSTAGTGPPQSRDSVTAQASGSRTDLLNFMNPQPSPLSQPEKKRSFFASSSSSAPKPKGKKLSRASTSNIPDDTTGKKKRFSVLSSMFGGREKRNSSSNSTTNDTAGLAPSENGTEQISPAFQKPLPPTNQSQHPQHVRRSEPIRMSSGQSGQQPIGGPQYQPGPAAAPKPARTKSQQRNVLTKQPSFRDSSKHRQESRSRRTSSSGFFGGIIGRKSQQEEKRPDDQEVNAKPLSPQPTVPDLGVQPQPFMQQHEQQQQQPRSVPWHEDGVPFNQSQYQSQQQLDRGRRPSREPVYDSVPIPGGYSLVRGVDSQVNSNYDPRGFSQHMDPRYMQQGQAYNGLPHIQTQHILQDQAPTLPQIDGTNEVREKQSRPPNLGTLETYEDYQRRRAPRRLSREEIIARSPAREPVGQQRPYQLSLPGEDESSNKRTSPEGRKTPKYLSQDIPPTIDTPEPAIKHDSIQRLQQPILRHPESPAGYPLPADTISSPINPVAADIPPPSPPQWPKSYTADSSQDLERSNTRKTQTSDVSQVSAEAVRSLAPQKQVKRGSTSSPSITPDRIESPGPSTATRRREVIAPARSEEDIYGATPPRAAKFKNGDVGHEGKQVTSSTTRGKKEQEEKIFLRGENLPAEREQEGANMSATSYPGQEWHPYGPGYEEWD